MRTQVLKSIEGYENATIFEDSENWYIDLHLGMGEAIYSKCDFSLEKAIEDSVNWKME